MLALLLLLTPTVELTNVRLLKVEAIPANPTVIDVVPPSDWQISVTPTYLPCQSDSGTHRVFLWTNVATWGRGKRAQQRDVVLLSVSPSTDAHVTGVCNLVDASGALVQLRYDITVVEGASPLSGDDIPTVRIYPTTD